MWNEIPSFYEVRDALRNRAAIQAEVRMTELQIQLLEAQISQEKPRNTAARIIGSNDENGRRMVELRMQLANLRNDLDRADAEIKFFDFHKEIYKSISYNSKL